jgi:large subunit ribosomal protein L15
MPLQRRLPKRGFKNLFRVEFSVTNVGKINERCEGKEVGPEELKKKGLVPRKAAFVKVLGTGEIKKSLTVKAHRFSSSAKEKIEKAGGKVVVLSKKEAPKKTESSSNEA